MKTFNKSKSYRTFVNKRDEALERILRNNRLRIADKMNKGFNDVLALLQRDYKQLNTLFHAVPLKNRLNSFEGKINHIFENTALGVALLIFDMRKKAFMLSYAGEVEALSQATQKPLKYSCSKYDMDKWVYEEPFSDGQKVLKKVDVYFNRLRRTIMNELEIATSMNEPIEKAIGRIIMKLPKKKHIDQARKLKKVPKKIKEAAKPKGDLISFQFLDSGTWDNIVDDYTNEYIPIDRSPAAVHDALNPFNDEPIREEIPSDEAFYDWEIERDATHDFVKQVRDGQVDAANENGITDFVIIAILDDRTCEDCCGEDYGCATFNGKLSSEVEKLTKGEFDVPPYHFNCRCTVSPATADLEIYDISQTEKDFEKWLNP